MDLKQLIEQLAYLDHENETDVAGEMADLITHIKIEGLTQDEAEELLKDRVELMKLNSVLADDEQIRLVEAFIQRVPGLLFA